MKLRTLVGVSALVVTVVAPSVLAHSQTPSKRVVFLSILPPNAPADARPVQLTTLEGEMATMAIPNTGQFGFTPSFRKDDDKNVVVTISDTSANPARELSKVDVPIGGKPVASKTKPSFDIQVTRVTQPK
jgi:hypothetical protein